MTRSAHQVQNRLPCPAERRRGQSSFGPSFDSTAGSRVSATSVAVEGMNRPDMPMPRTSEFGTTMSANRPSEATRPLNQTECPARFMAARTAASLVRPAARSSRQRVTTSSE